MTKEEHREQFIKGIDLLREALEVMVEIATTEDECPYDVIAPLLDSVSVQAALGAKCARKASGKEGQAQGVREDARGGGPFPRAASSSDEGSGGEEGPR
jgi:hypothetical protein